MRKQRRWFFVLAVLLAAALTGINFAATSTSTAITVQEVGTGIEVTEVESPNPLGRYNEVLGWDVVLNSARAIPAGDLLLIESEQADVLVTLYLENPAELARNYTYLQMKVQAFECTGNWNAATKACGDGWSATASDIVGDSDEVFLNLTKGFVSFTLDGNNQYSVGVTSGSYYAVDADTENGALGPVFLVEARPR